MDQRILGFASATFMLVAAALGLHVFGGMDTKDAVVGVISAFAIIALTYGFGWFCYQLIKHT